MRRPLLIFILSSLIMLIACVAVVVPIVIVNATRVEDQPSDAFSTRVKTGRGTVRGFNVDYGSDRNSLFFGAAEIFLGIPFSQPPVDELRFQLPRPVCQYNGEVGELEYKMQCAQAPQSPTNPKPSSEDCLYLNIFTPSSATPGKYPVMFWIHGGSFLNSGADEFHYTGAVRNFVSNEVVVVTIQYRLGPFGFFTTFTPEFPPNRGIYDQLMALRWVKEEIAAFGGDPGRVTLFGESAGAISVSALSLSPLAQGLFQRMILESGTVNLSFRQPNYVRGSIERQRAAQWCDVTVDPIANRAARQTLQECLANKTTHELNKYDITWFMPGTLSWSIVRDGVMFPESTDASSSYRSLTDSFVQVLARSRQPIDTLIMDMRDEQALFVEEYYTGNVNGDGPSILRDWLMNRGYQYLTDDQVDRVTTLMQQTYQTKELNATDHLGWFELAVDAFSGEHFYRHLRQEAEWLKSRSSRVYLSTFSRENRICGPKSAIKGYNPIPHFSEVCYLWFTPDEWEAAANSSTITPQDIQVANNLGRVWTEFAKSGNVDWPESGTSFKFVKFDDSLDNVESGWRNRDNELFNERLPSIIGDYPPNHVSSVIESVLMNNGKIILDNWRESLESCE